MSRKCPFFSTFLILVKDVGDVILTFQMTCSIEIGESSCDKNRRSLDGSKPRKVTIEYTVAPNKLAYAVEDDMAFAFESSAQRNFLALIGSLIFLLTL